MSVWLLSFTEEGFALARRLAEGLRGKAARCGAPLGLAEWTDRAWEESEALVFVGAAGIAVRAIAPHVRSKAADPAVVVVDEGGRFAVPILSGHLGGANDMARKIAALCGAEGPLLRELFGSATTDRAVELLDGAGLREPVLSSVAAALEERLRCRAGGMRIAAVFFSNVYGVLGKTTDADELLARHRAR